MKNISDGIIGQFKNNIESVFQLINFDQLILEFTIRRLEKLNEDLKSVHGITNPYLLVEPHIRGLKNIRTNGSLKLHYDIMKNQSLVLLVSYFSSSIEEVFKNSVQFAINSNRSDIVATKESFKFSIEELNLYDFNLKDNVGNLIIQKKEISFQDMQSISREFSSFFNIDIPKDENVNNIILAQACRHCIIHSLSRTNTKFMNQIRSANPRSLKIDIQNNQDIKFNEKEIKVVADSMMHYLVNITDSINVIFE